MNAHKKEIKLFTARLQIHRFTVFSLFLESDLYSDDNFSYFKVISESNSKNCEGLQTCKFTCGQQIIFSHKRGRKTDKDRDVSFLLVKPRRLPKLIATRCHTAVSSLSPAKGTHTLRDGRRLQPVAGEELTPDGERK
jgi:hypothetical protein